MSRLNISPTVSKQKTSQTVNNNQTVNIIKRDIDEDSGITVIYPSNETDSGNEKVPSEEIERLSSEIHAYELIIDSITGPSYAFRDKLGYYVLTKERLMEILKGLTGEETIKITNSEYPVSCWLPLIYHVESILVGDGVDTKNFKYVYTNVIEQFKQWKISLKQIIDDPDNRE